MFRRFGLLFISCVIALSFPWVSCLYADHVIDREGRPPKPGDQFIWMEPHTDPQGVSVPGHWKYQGDPEKHRKWVPTQQDNDGKWNPGHWEPGDPPSKDAVWVPGAYMPDNRWVPGHWK